MFIKKRPGKVSVQLPDGTCLTRSDLPPKGTTRWVARKKAQVVAGVATGLLSEAEACKLYDLSLEELEGWMRLAGAHGLAGLKTTRLQRYRQP